MNRKVGVAGREVAALRRTGGVDDRRRAGDRARVALDVLQGEPLARPVEILGLAPELAHDVEPLLRIAVAGLVVVGQREPERLVFRLVPARDDVEPGAALADLVDRCDLLGDDDGVVRRRVDGGEDRDVARVGEQARRPGHGLQHRAVEVRVAAVADPARDRQHEVDARLVEHLGEADVVLERVDPALGHFGDRHAGGAVRGEGAEQEAAFGEHRVASRGHWIPSDFQMYFRLESLS